MVKAIEELDYKDENILSIVKKTMQLYLYSTINRALALVWGTEVEELIDDLRRQYVGLEDYRRFYCKTRMLDKSVMPIFIDMLQIDKIIKTEKTLNLSNFQQMVLFCKDKYSSDYVYYPYLVTMYDFSMIFCIEQLMKSEKPFGDFVTIYEAQIQNYVVSNYLIDDNINKIKQLIQVDNFKDKDITFKEAFLVKVNNNKKNKLRLAIANVRLNHNNFKKIVIDKPNRRYLRYRDMSKIINEAIDEKADMLIMPESYMPFEWLATVARTCARNNLAIVTGVEHIKIGMRIFNLSAIILPYEDLDNKSAFISFHLKTHYAPAEKQEINGYRLDEVKGGALSRDIHCYCVQVNSSDYGDSRITKPSKTEEKDIMRTKGGINSTILIDEIDIEKMREFQLKSYNLQAYDKSFKPTPPGFDPEIVLKKIKGESII